jgi:hypothetical protein
MKKCHVLYMTGVRDPLGLEGLRQGILGHFRIRALLGLKRYRNGIEY